MVEVKMTLPEIAVEDAEVLTQTLDMENKAATVHTALGLVRQITDLAGPNGYLIVQNANGKAVRINLEPLFDHT